MSYVKEVDMGLKQTALLAIVGLCYIFLLRTIGSLFPVVFGNLLLAQCSGILSFLACIAVLIFFVSFLKEYVSQEQALLRTASVLVIVGLSFVLVVHLKEILPLFDTYTFSSVSGSHNFDVLVPWLSSVFMVFFFIVFYRQIDINQLEKLKRAALVASLGSFLLALMRTYIVWQFFTSRELVWFSDLSEEAVMIFIPVSAIGFMSVLYFFVSFYQEHFSRALE
jgi:hypothetical protein